MRVHVTRRVAAVMAVVATLGITSQARAQDSGTSGDATTTEQPADPPASADGSTTSGGDQTTADAPAADQPAPVADAPAADQPAAEQPATDSGSTDAAPDPAPMLSSRIAPTTGDVPWTGQGADTGSPCNEWHADGTGWHGPAIPDGNIGYQFNLTDGSDPVLHLLLSNGSTLVIDTATPGAPFDTHGPVYHFFVILAVGVTPVPSSGEPPVSYASNGSGQLTISHCSAAIVKNTPPTVSISKDAAGTYDTKYGWTVSKTVDKAEWKLFGGSATPTYTVTYTKDSGTQINKAVSGTITVEVTDPDVGDPGVVATVSDTLSNGTSCTISDAPSNGVYGIGDTVLHYSCSLGDDADIAALTNTATVSWNAQDDIGLTAGSKDYKTGTIGFTEHAKIDNCISATDTFNGGTPTVLQASLCDTATFNPKQTIPVMPGCTSYQNIAAFTTETTGATGSASATVTVCGPMKTGALTMGYWQNKNGQSQILNAGSVSGVCKLTAYLRQYAPFQDLSATATCTQVATYVTNVIKAANASGASMNAMLKAQMLATALDVFFSTTHLGSTKVDLTMICTDLTCTAVEDSSAVFGGSPKTVTEMLTYAASQSNVGGSMWYGNVKTTQELAKDAFDAINNEKVFGV